jgi:hypothetical protein
MVTTTLRDDAGVDPVPPPTSDAGHRRLPARGVASLVIVVALARWLFAADRRIYHLVPDESAQLAMSRFLGGGGHWNMLDHIGYRPGFATLIAPLAWLSEWPTVWFRAVIAVNALLGGVAAALLAVLARRWSTMSDTGCLLVAGIVACFPAGLVASAHVWAEPLLTVMFLLTLLAMLALGDRPAVGRALGAVALGAAGFTVHNRLLPLALATVPVAVILLARRTGWMRSALIVVPWSLACLAASVLYKRWVTARVWEAPASGNSIARTADRFERVGAVLDATVGQAWYQLAATAGAVGIGVVVVVMSLRRSWACRLPTNLSARDALVLIAAIAPSAGVSAVFMAGRTRVDQLVYGRYVDSVAGPLIVLGAAWLVGAAGRQRTAIAGAIGATTVATAVFVHLAHGSELREGIGLRMMIPGILAANGPPTAVRVLLATLVGVAALAALTLACRPPTGIRRLVVGLGVVALVLGAAGVRTHDLLDERLNGWARDATLRDVPAAELPPGSTIEVRFVPDREGPSASYVVQRQIVQAMQFHRPDLRFVGEGRAGTYLVATPLDDPEMLAADAVLVWSDPVAEFALYRLPDPA